MGKASSTKKVQRISRTGGGRKSAAPRSGGSMLWPALITIVVLAGVGLIAFSRNQNLSKGAGPHPRLGDHVHDAYGIYDCTKFLANLQDAKADTLGIHTHGDGLIHIHPFSSSVAGHNATLQAFGNQVNMKFSNGQVKLPTGLTLKTGGKCGSKPATLKAMVWSSPADTTPTTITKDLGKIRLTGNQLITIAYVSSGTKVPRPPSEAELAAPSDLSQTPTPGSTPTPSSTPASSAPATTPPSTGPPTSGP